MEFVIDAMRYNGEATRTYILAGVSRDLPPFSDTGMAVCLLLVYPNTNGAHTKLNLWAVTASFIFLFLRKNLNLWPCSLLLKAQTAVHALCYLYNNHGSSVPKCQRWPTVDSETRRHAINQAD